MDKFKLIPVMFQKVYEVKNKDTRFAKVKIWLMHLEENLHGSYFAKKVVQEAIPSLANTPILAYIEENSDGEIDASDHRSKVIKKDGDWVFKYKGQAYGVIPETNNATFEKRVCDDGIEREFLTVEGLIWTKWDDPIDILNRDLIKNQSMEIDEEFEGRMHDDGFFHFSKFKFYGACMLGLKQRPAMRSASIELEFSQEDYLKQVQEKMEEYKQLQLEFSKKGGDQEVDKKLELLAKYSKTAEELDIDLDSILFEDLEEKLKDFDENEEANPENPESEDKDKDQEGEQDDTSGDSDKVKKDNENNDIDDTSDDTENPDGKVGNSEVGSDGNQEKTTEYSIVFQLSHDDIRIQLYGYLGKLEEANGTYYWVDKVYDDSFIYCDGHANKFFKQPYKKNENDIETIGEAVEVFPEFLTKEELDSVRNKIDQYSVLESKLNDMEEKINKYALEERKEEETELFEKYEVLSGNKEYEEIKKKSVDFSTVEDLEKEIALIFARTQLSFSTKKKENKIFFSDGDKREKKEPIYSDLLEKYGKK